MKTSELITLLVKSIVSNGDSEVYIKPEDIIHPLSMDLTEEYSFKEYTFVRNIGDGVGKIFLSREIVDF